MPVDYDVFQFKVGDYVKTKTRYGKVVNRFRDNKGHAQYEILLDGNATSYLYSNRSDLTLLGPGTEYAVFHRYVPNGSGSTDWRRYRGLVTADSADEAVAIVAESVSIIGDHPASDMEFFVVAGDPEIVRVVPTSKYRVNRPASS